MSDARRSVEPAAQVAAHARQASFGQTARAVLWSFFGVRKRADYENDAARLNPVHVILMGIAAAALFVLTLILVVRFVTH